MPRHSSKGHASTGAAHGPSQRQLRVGEEIRHALSTILMEGELRDPDLAGVSITVSEVRPSPDLRNATAFVMPLAGANVETSVAALNRASAFLRGRLGRMVHLKFTPAIKFVADASFDEASHINTLLREDRVARDLYTDEAEEAHTSGAGALKDGT